MLEVGLLASLFDLLIMFSHDTLGSMECKHTNQSCKPGGGRALDCLAPCDENVDVNRFSSPNPEEFTQSVLWCLGAGSYCVRTAYLCQVTLLANLLQAAISGLLAFKPSR